MSIQTFLVISLALVATILFAGCISPPSGSELVTPTATPAVTASPEEAAVPVDSAITLGRMHGIMMEAIEEALAYPVLNETEEKSDFETRLAEFHVLADRFAVEAALDEPGNAGTREAFDSVLARHGEFVEAADTFFIAYETDWTVRTEDVTVFEVSIDAFTSEFGPFTKNYFDRVSEADLDDKDHARSALALLSMHRDIMEGIEEAFGYVLLGDSEEKDEFFQKMQDFEVAGSAFVDSAYLAKPENSELLNSYMTMMDARDRMELAASDMFDEYEKTGAVSTGIAMAFEIEVDSLTTAYDTLLEEVLEKL
ncbi:MAG: hypothetical protein APR55_08110 [Methanolinea sp. SDB]|nr:MAG: hypothetical protein APR55_08110 [Methanolinea sp. SDB]